MVKNCLVPNIFS